MLKKLNEIKTAKVYYVVLEKKKLYSSYLKNDRHKLYNYVSGKLANNLILENLDLEIRIDKSKGKQVLQNDFNNYFLKKLKECSSVRKVAIFHSYSQSWSGIQFADLTAWACFQKFEHSNSSYVDILTIDQEVWHVW